MKRYSRLFVALAILLSGVALVPYIDLSAEPIRWQQFADVYEPAPVQAEIRNFAFAPQVILIQVGTTVRWTNLDGAAHTVTSNGGMFDSGAMGSGESYEYRFDTPGAYAYFCAIHPSMTGTVIVVEQLLDQYLPIIIR